MSATRDSDPDDDDDALLAALIDDQVRAVRRVAAVAEALNFNPGHDAWHRRSER